jgi:hypothetical protein
MNFFYINKAKFETEKEIDGNNFLVAYDVPIAKTGIQEYTREEIGDKSGNPNDLVNVYRDHTVFDDKELIESFDGIPIVYKHPDNGKVDYNNFKDFIVGTVSGVYYKNGSLYAKKLTIIDKEAIRNVLNKNTNELSIGFRGNVEKKEGTFEGVKYHFKENVIHANHLALCENGKAGAYYAINSIKKGKKMATYSTNSVTEDHEKMKEDKKMENEDGGVKMKDIKGLIQQAVKEHLSHVKPKNFGDSEHEKKEYDEEDCMNEEEKEGKEERHQMVDSTSEELTKAEHFDKDVVNALKKSNTALRTLLNSKNKEIRTLEVQNIDLKDQLEEATEYMKKVASRLKSSHLVNAMSGPDNIASPSHPRNADLNSSMTSSFLFSSK